MIPAECRLTLRISGGAQRRPLRAVVGRRSSVGHCRTGNEIGEAAIIRQRASRAFISQATKLVAGDTDGRPDVFVHDRVTGRTSLVAPVSADSHAYVNFVAPPLTANGSAVALWTDRVLSPADGDRWTSTYLAWLQLDGVVYDFTVKPLALSFGERPLGSATHFNLWLRNKGATALPILRVFVRGTDAGMFAASHACGASLAPGAGCAIAVTFALSASGPRTAKVVLVAGDRQVRERVVTGTGIDAVAAH